jgi:hypothetical protein
MLFLACMKKTIASSACNFLSPPCTTTSTKPSSSYPRRRARRFWSATPTAARFITGAGNAPNVVGLVYLAGPALDEGESLRTILARRAPPPGFANVHQDQYGFLWIETDKFRETFCLDLDETESLVLALTQKPTAARCFEDKSGPPAWKGSPAGIRSRPTTA